MTDSYQHVDATRALQASASARQHNYESMVRWGAYSLMKVTPRSAPQDTVANYVTNLPALSHKTPRQMEEMLGLRVRQLSSGADIYRLLQLPDRDGFLPRGYSTLVDGLALRPGVMQDSAGYRPGLGAWQILLIKPVPAVRVASLAYDETFEPSVHPSLLPRHNR
jgi:hypothetical protein